MAAYSSSQNGNWSSAATWGGAGVPGIGDTATATHDVTVDVDTIVGTSPSDNTTIVLDFGVSGQTRTLIIAAGVTLTVRGNFRVTGVSGIIQMNAGSHWVFDSTHAGTPGVRYLATIEYQFSNYSLAVVGGTSGSRCSVSGGANGVDFTGQTTVGDRWYASYCDFFNCTINVQYGFGGGPNSVFDHCVFDTCAVAVTVGGGGYTQFTDTYFGRSIGRCNINGNGPHVIQNTTFDQGLNIRSSGLVTFNNVVCLAGVQDDSGGSDGKASAAFDTVFIRSFADQPSSGGNTVNTIGRRNDWTDVYMVVDAAVYDWLGRYSSGTADLVINPHWCSPSGAAGTYAMTGCVFDDFGSTGDGDCDYGPNGFGLNTAMSRCIGISQTADDPGTLVTFNGWDGCASTYDHCTWLTSQVGPLTVGESSLGYAGMVASYRSNVFWRHTPSATVFKLGSYNTGSLVTDIGAAANLDYNCGFNVANTGVCTNGYNLPLSGAPGVHDVDVNPQFVDPTRNFSTWVASLEPTWGAGSVFPANPSPSRTDYNAHGLFKLGLRTAGYATHPDYDARYTIAALLAYVRAGFAPTNAALKDAGHDGVTIGAVEAPAVLTLDYTPGNVVDLAGNPLAGFSGVAVAS